ncbi:MAG: collagen binding domain-containing protein [Acidobacteriaceae bacterium]
MKVFRLLTMFIFLSRMLPAQSPAPDAQSSTPPEAPAQQSAPPAPPPATGSITGHVYLGDSHLPARMAYVTLLPFTAAEAGDAKPVVSSATVQTGLDGAFVMPNILPGAYYVAAAKLGYASPVPASYLISDDAPKDMKEALAATLTPVVVSANRTSTTDIVLNKGAVIAGTVRFDDGEPDTQAVVSLLRKDKSGKWTEYATWDSLFSAGQRTDDQGNFRLTGLPAGEYLLRTTLELGGADIKSPGTDLPHDPDYRWDIYFGDGVRPRDAKSIQLKDGEESNGNNIEIPLAQLHSVSGTVLNAETGAPINRASVELHNADDDSTCTATEISLTTGQFHFPYVAEGEYTLKVTNASDIIPGKGDQKPIRTYADASQPLIVKGETSGVTIQVKPKPVAAAAAAR